MPYTKGKKSSVNILKHQSKKTGTEIQGENLCTKRSPPSPQGAPKKRSAFIDITNANKNLVINQVKKTAIKKTQKNSSITPKDEINIKKSESVFPVEQPEKETAGKSPVEESKELSVESSQNLHLLSVPQVPEEFDIDKEHSGDCFMTAEYAKEIFDYLKAREEKFVLENYMLKQPDLNQDMRGVLVDWMVEVQENFELNHETLYLAVKLTDHYLSHTVAMRETLQLIGSTSMLIASKFEERCPPCIDDFLYICDDAYKREELIAMEVNILQVLNFDINIPVAYRFLRRYSKCVKASMETLTLARYVCERSLLELELVPERASRLASACLLLTLFMKDLGGWMQEYDSVSLLEPLAEGLIRGVYWVSATLTRHLAQMHPVDMVRERLQRGTHVLEYHTGYTVSDLAPLVRKLHAMLACPTDDKLKAVKSKYSHKVFFEVAKTPLMTVQKLEGALK